MNAPKFRLKVADGMPVGHPAFEDNLLDAFSEIPAEWEPFEHTPNPATNNYKLLLLHPTPAYRKIDGVWREYWYVRERTQEELEALYKPIKDAWANRPYANNFTAWVFDPEKMAFFPPVPRPEDGKFYRWSGPENAWKLAEPFPKDGKEYYFDFDNWVNVEVTNV